MDITEWALRAGVVQLQPQLQRLVLVVHVQRMEDRECVNSLPRVGVIRTWVILHHVMLAKYVVLIRACHQPQLQSQGVFLTGQFANFLILQQWQIAVIVVMDITEWALRAGVVQLQPQQQGQGPVHVGLVLMGISGVLVIELVLATMGR